MGYSTDFEGELWINPPLNQEEVDFLTRFSQSRRVDRTRGPYDLGRDNDDIIDFNEPPEGQPSLWCDFEPNEDGTVIVWTGSEKTYEAEKWIKYLIDHFLKPDCLAKEALPFLQANHTVNGTLEAQGEERSDRWDLVVEDNTVYVAEIKTQAGPKKPV